MEKNKEKINVLINAYACSPNWGSELGIGWNWVVNLSKYCNLYIINEGEWKAEIEEALKDIPHKENIHFYFLPVSYIKGASFKHTFFVLSKNALNTIQARFHPRVKQAFRHSDVLIASGVGIQKKIKALFKEDAVLINDTGSKVIPFPIDKQPPKKGEEFHILWVGKFDYRKQLELVTGTGMSYARPDGINVISLASLGK